MFFNVSKKFKGFTVAELAITIGVIGVIAAITMPLAFRKHDDIAFESASKKVNYTLSNTLDLMNSDRNLAGHSTTKDFVDRFVNYVTVSKRCHSDDLSNCFPKTFEATGVEYSLDDIKSSAFMGKNNWCTDVEGVSLKNGVSMLIAYNPYCSSKKEQNCITALYDLNSIDKTNVFRGNGASDLGTYNAGFINGSDSCGPNNSGNTGGEEETPSGGEGPQIPLLPEGFLVNFEWDDSSYTTFHEAGKSAGDPSASSAFKSALVGCYYFGGYWFEGDEQTVHCYALKDNVYWAYYLDYFDGHWDISTSHIGSSEQDSISKEQYDESYTKHQNGED